jgi:hypothetical protein
VFYTRIVSISFLTRAFYADLNGVLGNYATLGLNIADFARYSNKPSAQNVQAFIIPFIFSEFPVTIYDDSPSNYLGSQLLLGCLVFSLLQLQRQPMALSFGILSKSLVCGQHPGHTLVALLLLLAPSASLSSLSVLISQPTPSVQPMTSCPSAQDISISAVVNSLPLSLVAGALFR